MANVKTTISIERSLYDMLNSIALDLKLSSNIILELALDEFVQRYQNNRELLLKINAAYDDLPDNEEQILLNRMKKRQRSLVEEKW